MGLFSDVGGTNRNASSVLLHWYVPGTPPPGGVVSFGTVGRSLLGTVGGSAIMLVQSQVAIYGYQYSR